MHLGERRLSLSLFLCGFLLRGCLLVSLLFVLSLFGRFLISRLLLRGCLLLVRGSLRGKDLDQLAESIGHRVQLFAELVGLFVILILGQLLVLLRRQLATSDGVADGLLEFIVGRVRLHVAMFDGPFLQGCCDLHSKTFLKTETVNDHHDRRDATFICLSRHGTASFVASASRPHQTRSGSWPTSSARPS